MGNKSKAIGTRAESAIVKYFKSLGISARRKALSGSKDQGDIEVYDAPLLHRPFTIEVKAGKQTANPSRSQLEEWLRQAREEQKNSGQSTALIVVRYNRALVDADVWWEHDGDVSHWWLDEFAHKYVKEVNEDGP